MYVTLYEVLEEEVMLGRSRPQAVTLIPVVFLRGLISSPPTFQSCCFSISEHLSFSTSLSKCEIPGAPQEGAVWGCTHCCWEHVFGPPRPIILKHQKPWKSSCPATQQSHFKRSKRERDSFKILFTKTFLMVLFILRNIGIMQISTKENR